MTNVIKDPQEMVADFHRLVGHAAPDTPRMLYAYPEVNARLKLIREETQELVEALCDEDLVEAADAIADLLYVTYGTAVAMGIDIGPVFEIVHESNMRKREGGYQDEATGKFIKPVGFVGPQEAIKAELIRQGWEG